MLELKEAIGLEGEIATIAAKNPQLIVFTSEHMLSDKQREFLGKEWREVTKGTALEGVKCVMLHSGMTMQIVDDVG